MAGQPSFDMITVVVQYKDQTKVIDALLKAGAKGATYYYGRGTGVRQRLGTLGKDIEPEKVVIFTAVPEEQTSAVVAAATESAGLSTPGNGFLTVNKLSHTVGFF